MKTVDRNWPGKQGPQRSLLTLPLLEAMKARKTRRELWFLVPCYLFPLPIKVCMRKWLKLKGATWTPCVWTNCTEPLTSLLMPPTSFYPILYKTLRLASWWYPLPGACSALFFSQAPTHEPTISFSLKFNIYCPWILFCKLIRPETKGCWLSGSSVWLWVSDILNPDFKSHLRDQSGSVTFKDTSPIFPYN